MRLLLLVAAAAAGTACASFVVADPSRLLAPDEPAYRSGWRPPAPPTSGLRPYRPVAAKNWLELGKSGSGGPMPGNSGMGAPSKMPGMPGMGGGR